VVLPLLVVVLAMLCTMGIMALSGVALSLATQILPSFLIAVGVCDGIHILEIFYQRLGRDADKEEAIAFTLGHSGLAILMTSLTTAGGLASFMASEFKPVADLGRFAPIGVMLAFVFSVVLLPALLAAIPVGAAQHPRLAPGRDRVGRALEGIGAFAAARPWGVVAVTLVILAVSLAGATRLRFSHNAMCWFPEREPMRVGTLLMNDRLKGISTIEIVISTGEENGLHEPAGLDQLEEVARFADSMRRDGLAVAKTISLVDVVKEIHQALNENRPAFYAIPRDRRLVAQELLLFENSGSDDLEDFVDSRFSTARVTLRVPWTDAVIYPPLLEQLEAGLEDIFGEDVEVEVTGLVAVLGRTFVAMIHSMARSYVIALLVITPLMILLIGQLRRGLLSMIPNLTPVAMTLGLMGWSGLPLDGSTLMIGAIVIGLAVDNTIHFMHNFRRYYDQTGDAREAIRQTLETTGRALLLTSLVLGAGFFTFTGAYMKSTFNFGMLAGLAILVAFLANVLLSSSLMVLATRRERALKAGSGAGSG
jgi:predicted RND superfamily exporter protein